MAFRCTDLERVLQGLGDGPLESLHIVTATFLAGRHYPAADPAQPLLITGLSTQSLAAEAMRVLLQSYPASHLVTTITDGARRSIPLSELPERSEFGALTCLYVAPLPAPASYVALQDVVARLRAPGGCPWDQELTWEKVRSTILEETHELLSAIDAGSVDKVTEELGDVLLQVAMVTQIATEQNLFRAPDIMRQIVTKLVRRHPHVFGDARVSGTDEVLANWEAIKRAERSSKREKGSLLSGVPKGLPALAQAEAYLDRISRVKSVDVPEEPWRALADLPEEEGALTPEILGEAMFGLVAWARERGIDVESALRKANARFAAEVEAQEEKQ